MAFPTQLRAPRAPAQLPPGVITGARPAADHEIPAGALRVAQAAAVAGWETAVTYALAEGVRGRIEKTGFDEENPRAPKTRRVETPGEIPSVAVRMLKPGRAYRVALWNDGAFDVCWHFDARKWHRIMAPARPDGRGIMRRAPAPAYLARLFARETALIGS